MNYIQKYQLGKTLESAMFSTSGDEIINPILNKHYTVTNKHQSGGTLSWKQKFNQRVYDAVGPNKAIKLIQPKRFQKGGNLNTRFYNAIDPTDGYPSAQAAAQYITRIASGTSTPKRIEPVADAAWRKRLGLPYDEKLLPPNKDGSVTLPKNYINELLVDTNAVKNRIRENEISPELEKAIESGTVSLDPEYQEDMKIRRNLVNLDKDYLNKLRRVYKGDTVVVNEHQAWKNRKLYNQGRFDDKVITPFSLMQNFTMYKDKDGNINFEDTYDFNQFEKIIPGQPFKIKGKINDSTRK